MEDEKGDSRAASCRFSRNLFMTPSAKTGWKTQACKCLRRPAALPMGHCSTTSAASDNIVIESTAHCMAKVEDDFMANAPRVFEDIERFLREMPYLTAKMHGAKYRFMYQVYASPKYREYGKEFFKGVNVRYHEYAVQLSK